jgi:hypothetical protein
VERAFGVSKNTWQFLDRPILLHDLEDISNRVVSCLLLHNILQDTLERYDPSKGALTAFNEVEQPADIQVVVQAAPAGVVRTVVGINMADMTRSERFAELE